MVKAVIFDLDNTLIDFLSFKQETAKAVAIELKRHGWKLTEQQQAVWFSKYWRPLTTLEHPLENSPLLPF